MLLFFITSIVNVSLSGYVGCTLYYSVSLSVLCRYSHHERILYENKIVSFLLALGVVLGLSSPVLAGGPAQHSNRPHDVNMNDNRIFMSDITSDDLPEPEFGMSYVFVHVNFVGLNGKPFDVDTFFPDGKISLFLDDYADEQYDSIRLDANQKTTVFADTPVKMMSVLEGAVYVGLEFPDDGISEDLQKLVIDDGYASFKMGERDTDWNMTIYQIRNTDVIVTTPGYNENPSTDSQIQVNNLDGDIIEIEDEEVNPLNLPKTSELTSVWESRSTVDIEEINPGIGVVLTNLNDEGLLVDQSNPAKLFKPVIEVDPNGIEPTIITLLEKKKISYKFESISAGRELPIEEVNNRSLKTTMIL